MYNGSSHDDIDSYGDDDNYHPDDECHDDTENQKEWSDYPDHSNDSNESSFTQPPTLPLEESAVVDEDVETHGNVLVEAQPLKKESELSVLINAAKLAKKRAVEKKKKNKKTLREGHGISLGPGDEKVDAEVSPTQTSAADIDIVANPNNY